jgi:hypothetical protein
VKHIDCFAFKTWVGFGVVSGLELQGVQKLSSKVSRAFHNIVDS